MELAISWEWSTGATSHACLLACPLHHRLSPYAHEQLVPLRKKNLQQQSHTAVSACMVGVQTHIIATGISKGIGDGSRVARSHCVGQSSCRCTPKASTSIASWVPRVGHQKLLHLAAYIVGKMTCLGGGSRWTDGAVIVCVIMHEAELAGAMKHRASY